MKIRRDDNRIYTKEKQGEFFSEFETQGSKKGVGFFKKDLASSRKATFDMPYENGVMFLILFILLCVVFFSLGVEKGKRIALHSKIKPTLRIKETEKKEGSKKDSPHLASIATDDNAAVQTAEIAMTTARSILGNLTKPYTIQVIAFKKEENAKNEMQALRNAGHEVLLIPSKDWFQVCVGKYKDKEDCQKDLEILRKKYPSCYIRNIE